MSARPRSLVVRWREAVRDSELDKTAKIVGFVLSTYMNTAGEAFPSKATISAGASLGEGRRAVDKAIERLETAWFLDVTKSKGRRPFHYRALFPTSQTGATLTAQADATLDPPNVALGDSQRRTNGLPTSQTDATEVGLNRKRNSAAALCVRCRAAPPAHEDARLCPTCAKEDLASVSLAQGRPA